MKIFNEFIIKNKTIKNRIVMPPMVCFGWADDTGIVSNKHIEHYKAAAKGGAGLIIVEANCISSDGRLSQSQLGIWSDRHVYGLKQIVNACHDSNAKVMVQLHHAGSLSFSKNHRILCQ